MIYDAVMQLIYRSMGNLVDMLPGGTGAPAWVSQSFGYLYVADGFFPIAKVSAFVGVVASVETGLLTYALMSKMWSRQ